MNKIVQETFPWVIIPDREHVHSNEVWFTAEQEDINKHRHELKAFLKNSDNEIREGVVMHSRAVISGHKSWKYIDIIPIIGGKRIGVRYAKQYFNFPSNRTVVAGDSGNDIEMLRDDHFGIVVENADQDMTKWITKKPRLNKFKSEFKWGDAIVHGIEQIFYNTH